MKNTSFSVFLISAEFFLAVLSASVGVLRGYSLWYYLIPIFFLLIVVRDIYLHCLHKKNEKLLTKKQREIIETAASRRNEDTDY